MPEYITVFRKWEGDEEMWEPITNKTKANFPIPTWQEWASPVYKPDLLEFEKSDLISQLLELKAENFRLKFNCNPDLPLDWYSDSWMDINRTDVLNNYKGARNEKDEKHIAPLQLDIIERCIAMWSNPGEVVLTPFMGVGSECYGAILNDRKAIGIELKESYFRQSIRNLETIEREMKTETLF
jgi:DNA modification methylase